MRAMPRSRSEKRGLFRRYGIHAGTGRTMKTGHHIAHGQRRCVSLLLAGSSQLFLADPGRAPRGNVDSLKTGRRAVPAAEGSACG